MPDTEQQPTPGGDAADSKPTPKPRAGSTKSSKRKPKRKSSNQRNVTHIDRNAPLHQARVFAMQALYEDDLTGHGLDDILQHMGEQTRKEHVDYFHRARGEAVKALEEIGFLARNADFEVPDSVVPRFKDARDIVLSRLFELPESEESEIADEYISRRRVNVEQSLRSVITEMCKRVEQSLERIAAGSGVGAAERDLEFSKMEAETIRRLDSTLTREELAGRANMMDVIDHCARLARGVQAQQEAIDPHIVGAAPAFPILQLASIDRGVLRIAVYELLFEPAVPFKAAINEAVEIAKRYGGPKTGGFVNGVLRTISERLLAERKRTAE